MEKEKKVYARKTLYLLLIFVMLVCIALSSLGINASADSSNCDEETNVETRGLMTKISVQLSPSNGNVRVLAHNDFTLGFSTVKVYVEVYSSLTYQESYKDMTLENRNYISDLNINKSLETSAPINGVERYWRGRVYYKLDNKDWTSMETRTYLIGADGQILQ